VRPTTQRGNGSAPQPKAGLSDGRLALVQQYMVDAEEAEALAEAEAENDDAPRARQEASVAAVGQRARPNAVEQATLAEATTTRPRADARAPEETLRRAPATPTNGTSRVPEETANVNRRPDPREEARARKELVKADKLAAKQAAREIATLEKKEARERKALAKAAARRRWRSPGLGGTREFCASHIR